MIAHSHANDTAPITPAPTVDDALTLASCGLPIIPLAPRTKQPSDRFSRWQERATTVPALIRAWWRKWPDANIGLVIPRGRLVLDVDPRHGGLIVWDNLCRQYGELPATWKVWSGGEDRGFHLHYALPEDVCIPGTTAIDPMHPLGVQIFGYRHLVVLPGSVHPDSGRAYAWDVAHNPSTLPTPAVAPDWLLDLLDVHAKKSSGRARGGSPPISLEKVEGDTPKPPGKTCIAAQEQDAPPPCPTSCSAGTPPPSKGYGDRAATLLRASASMPALGEVLNYPEHLQDGMSVPCPCPEHTHGDQSPSGVWREPRGKTPDYGIWCFKAQKFYTLNELFHFHHSGNLIKLRAEVAADGTRHEHRRIFLLWGLRALERAGLLMIPKQWGYPMLPPSAPEDSRTLWQVILDVKRFRNATEQGGHEPLPLSYRFLRDWSPAVRDWKNERLQTANTWLVSKSFLRKVGEYGKGLQKTALWIIGKREQRQACKEAPVERTVDKAVESVDATPVPEPVQVDRTSACPYADVREPDFDSKHCEYCAQASLETKRAQASIWIDPGDPFGLGSLARSPT